MWGRWLALAATIWTGAYVGAYLAIVYGQGDAPAWWYVGLVAIGVLPLVAVVGGWSSRPLLVTGAVVLGLASLVGLLSIGIFLVPAVACAVAAAFVTKPAPSAASGPTGESRR